MKWVWLVGAVIQALGMGTAWADPFPSKPLTWVVPYPPGGPGDLVARNIAPQLARELGQPVVIENLGGASGTIGAAKVLNAPADGYTLFQATVNELILAPLVNPAVKVRAADFQMLSPVVNIPLVLVARKDFPADTADEFIQAARTTKTPLSFGSVGPGTLFHVTGEDFGLRTGGKVLHVPYKGIGPMLQDIAGGSVDFAIIPFTSQYVGLQEQGRLKILAAADRQRIPAIPQVPTFDEGQLLKGFHYGGWIGLTVKKGTPKATLDRLHSALAAAVKNAEVGKGLVASGFEVEKTQSLDDSARFWTAEHTRYTELAVKIKLSAQ